MTREEVDSHRDRYSRAKDQGPWIDSYVPMGIKTCIRKMYTFLPSSVETQRALVLDDLAERGIPQDLEMLIGGEGTPEIEGQSDEPSIEDQRKQAIQDAQKEKPKGATKADPKEVPNNGAPPKDNPTNENPLPYEDPQEWREAIGDMCQTKEGKDLYYELKGEKGIAQQGEVPVEFRERLEKEWRKRKK